MISIIKSKDDKYSFKLIFPKFQIDILGMNGWKQTGFISNYRLIIGLWLETHRVPLQ